MMHRRIAWMLVFAMLAGGIALGRPVLAAGNWVTGSVSTSAGSRNYKLWVPAGYNASTPAPLVMMLHGCSQNPDNFAAGTAMNTLADTNNFLVVYPEQPSSIDSLQCWQWWDPAHQSRGAGEPAILAAMVSKIKTSYSVDSNQTFVAGMSAGAAMAVIMGATYPDVFAAIGVNSGLEYQATTSRLNAYTAMSQGGPSPDTQGYKAYQAMGSARRPVRVIVFHGTSDYTVAQVNGDQVATQWAQTNDYADDGSNNDSVDASADVTTPGSVAGGRAYTRYQYFDASGATIIEKWIVQGMGHAWSGGSSSGSYTDPQGPSASAEMWRFFSNGSTPQPTATAVPPTSQPTATPVVPSTPTVQPTATVPPTATPAPNQTTVSFISIGSEDGYAASALANGTTGGYSVGSTVSVGDNADAPFRGILSFDTSSLPDGAVVTGAELRLYATQAPIGNPWNGLGSLVGDIKTGCLGSACTLASSDFQAATSADSVVVLSSSAPSGGAGTLVSGTLDSSGRGAINRTGKTQFKLRFQNLSNSNWLSDYLLLGGGEYSISSYRPVLVVTYQ